MPVHFVRLARAAGVWPPPLEPRNSEKSANTEVLMRHLVSLVTLLVAVAHVHVVQAQGNLTVDVSGIPGSGQSTWTFSGSYTVGDVSQLTDAYSLLGVLPAQTDDNINNFTH